MFYMQKYIVNKILNLNNNGGKNISEKLEEGYFYIH